LCRWFGEEPAPIDRTRSHPTFSLLPFRPRPQEYRTPPLLPVCIGGQDVKLVGRELLAVWSDGGAGGRHGGMAAAPSAPSSSSFVGSTRRRPRRGRIWARRVVWWKSGGGGATPTVRSSPSLSARSLQWQEEWGAVGVEHGGGATATLEEAEARSVWWRRCGPNALCLRTSTASSVEQPIVHGPMVHRFPSGDTIKTCFDMPFLVYS
jgi:hypothetical protein